MVAAAAVSTVLSNGRAGCGHTVRTQELITLCIVLQHSCGYREQHAHVLTDQELTSVYCMCMASAGKDVKVCDSDLVASEK